MKSAFIIIILCTAFSYAQTYVLKSYVIDDGGISKMTSSGYVAGWSISQTAIEKVTSPNYVACLGYWTPFLAPPGIEEKEQNQSLTLSIVFSLGQNYPNPVASKTIIKYSIAKESNVELKIYDVCGRQVVALVNETQKSGYYYVNWHIGNVLQKQLANGVYFYRLKAGDFTSTKKMIILR
jgi:hypothetical protein